MTIQDAIRSGKRFKRPVMGGWYDPYGSGAIEPNDILATDWEVETIKKEFSAVDIITAINNLHDRGQYITGTSGCNALLKELGLE